MTEHQTYPKNEKGQSRITGRQLKERSRVDWIVGFTVIGLVVVYLSLPSEDSSGPKEIGTGNDLNSNPAYIEQALGLELEMVKVEGGAFKMGCTKERDGYCRDNEKPTHEVSLNDFYMGRYEVTQAQWQAVMGDNPSQFADCDECPVENVFWEDVQAFVAKLNRQTGKQYRLPTEAEWEFAARGGQKTKGYKYAGGNYLDAVAWYDNNSMERTHEIGQKKANELGIHDMNGNVWEWCHDWYDPEYYEQSPVNNPKGPTTGAYHVMRGGSWRNASNYTSIASRFDKEPELGMIYGFRLAMDD